LVQRRWVFGVLVSDVVIGSSVVSDVVIGSSVVSERIVDDGFICVRVIDHAVVADQLIGEGVVSLAVVGAGVGVRRAQARVGRRFLAVVRPRTGLVWARGNAGRVIGHSINRIAHSVAHCSVVSRGRRRVGTAAAVAVTVDIDAVLRQTRQAVVAGAVGVTGTALLARRAARRAVCICITCQTAAGAKA
jgi:hypothetical protein